MNNYRLISNLTFMSKILEKLVCRQITAFLEENNLLKKMQSAYRRNHPTETAVLKICDRHTLRRWPLRRDVALPSRLLRRFRHGRLRHSSRASREGFRSSWASHGVNQIVSVQEDASGNAEWKIIITVRATVQRPAERCTRSDPIPPVYSWCYRNRNSRHGLSAHSYAYDAHLRFYEKALQSLKRLPSLKVCDGEVDKWMSSNRLKLNADKAQFMWFEKRSQLAEINCLLV